MRKVLLISNRVMHYRVSVYNYFSREFAKRDWLLVVRTNQLQKENPHPINFDFKQIPFRFFSYVREINEVAPDAVILFLHLKDGIIWPLTHWLKSQGIPVAFWTKGINLDRPNSITSNLLYKYMHRISDALILYSRHEEKYINARYRKKLFVANNTLNFEDFPVIEESKESIKRQFGIPFRKVVLSVGRMGVAGQRKKVDHLIEIFRRIANPDAGLVIVGSGVNDDHLGRANPRNTMYLGEIHDPEQRQISKLFKISDVFSIPGHVGLGLNQAMFWGLPVVTEDGKQPPEIHYLIDGRNGFLVPEDDRTALEQRICYLLENDAVRAEFGRNARADILANASISRMFEGFLRCVESVA